MSDLEIGFIGFGLIGGSIARGLKRKNEHPFFLGKTLRITVYDYHIQRDGDSYQNIDLQKAKEDQTIHSITGRLSDLSSCDIIFLCAPVQQNLLYLEQLRPLIKKDCMITDVGSVKGNIQARARQLGLLSNFLGGHPMAGSEQTGYQSSSDLLLENAYYILTPEKETPAIFVERMTSIIRQIGAIPILLEPKEHDDITAAISHVPHLIAASLVNMVRERDKEDKMQLLAAGGFKDITRIASSSPVIWRDICLSNTESILDFLTYYRRSLETLEQALREGNRQVLYSTFETSKEFRDSLPTRSRGLIEKIHELFVDVRDTAGAIARIATLLAAHDINIKNIGILHNREFQNGALRIELPDDTSVCRTQELLEKNGYTIYR